MASTSSNPYPDFAPNAAAAHPQHIPSGHWPPGLRPGALPHPPPQSQPMNGNWSAPNPLLQQSFPAPIPGFPPFNIPFISHQMLQDALAMSAPVEASDEPLLVQALIDSRIKKESYRDALNALHGKNGHSANLWKDYYLDHKDRLDSTIANHLNPSKPLLQTAKKPSPSDFKTDTSPILPPRPLPKRRTPAEKLSLDRPSPLPVASRRSTINSLTAPTPVFSMRLPPPNADIQVPKPPSRSPTPPTIVVPHCRGNKFTPQDRDYFLKFISWRLKADSTLTRQDLCILLAEKAPHHTAQSWNSHWQNKHDLPDKILAAARGEKHWEDGGSESEAEQEVRAARRPTYRDPSSSEEEDDDSKEEAESDSSDTDDNGPPKVWSENEMGPPGSSFTDADLYVTAKHIASFAAWDKATGKERWGPFGERFPQRSWKAWAEYYRRNSKQLHKLARKIKSQNTAKQPAESSSSIHLQRARPTWALADGNDPPQIKRKYQEAEGDEEGTPGRLKRGKGAISNP